MPRILHVGLGNFHRAHQAWYTHAAGGWQITGVSINNRRVRDLLTAQHGRYTLVQLGPSGPKADTISVHDRCLVLADEPDAVIAEMAAPDTQIVTLTITEKGYALGSDGRLDLSNPAIAADLDGGAPTSVIGALAQGLAARATHGAPLTVLSCDNLAHNGPSLRRAVMDFAKAAQLDLSAYMQASVRFPATMVDRITPATTEKLRTKWDDPAVVLTEAFTEWVIEDDFATPRPAWDQAGAVFTHDVVPFEARKLYILNAAHSLLAYAGLMRGHVFVHQAIADPDLRAKTLQLWKEARALIPAALHADVPDYQEALLTRFSVPGMAHRLDQIAQDGAQKIPIRIEPILRARQRAGQHAPACQFALDAWMKYRG